MKREAENMIGSEGWLVVKSEGRKTVRNYPQKNKRKM